MRDIISRIYFSVNNTAGTISPGLATQGGPGGDADKDPPGKSMRRNAAEDMAKNADGEGWAS